MASINIDVHRWTRVCLMCQLTKVQCNMVSTPCTFTPPDSRFSHVHLDLIGPLPPTQNSRYMLTCADRFTRWPEALPLTDITAESVARWFITLWMSRYGVPKTISLNRGRQLESALFRTLPRMLGFTTSRRRPNTRCRMTWLSDFTAISNLRS
ncbi:hypothetical protein MRX96_029029 [Rhipicephalus microplus]